MLKNEYGNILLKIGKKAIKIKKMVLKQKKLDKTPKTDKLSVFLLMKGI